MEIIWILYACVLRDQSTHLTMDLVQTSIYHLPPWMKSSDEETDSEKLAAHWFSIWLLRCFFFFRFPRRRSRFEARWMEQNEPSKNKSKNLQFRCECATGFVSVLFQLASPGNPHRIAISLLRHSVDNTGISYWLFFDIEPMPTDTANARMSETRLLAALFITIKIPW